MGLDEVIKGMELEQLDARGRPRVRTSFEGSPSLTVQSDAPKADIQQILKQFDQVGIIENLNNAEAVFADISEFTDFADAMRHAKMAEGEFMKLPSKVREIFGHSVENWLDTAHDPEKRNALVEAGIIEGPKVPEVAPKAPTPAGEDIGGEEAPE